MEFRANHRETAMANETSGKGQGGGNQGGPPKVQLTIQTPRGAWTMTQPADAAIRPEYEINTKVEQVITDARSVFKFVESDSKYTLHFNGEQLAPQRTLASYQIKDGSVLVLSVQGGNA
jgi:hypothetical protein